MKNRTLSLNKESRNVKVIGCKWILARMYDKNGHVICQKARLVAQGFLQTKGVNFFHTYSPIASIISIIINLAINCAKIYKIRQFDVESAFLNGDLEEKVYIRFPQGVSAEQDLERARQVKGARLVR